jgi:hypothetical protein
MKRWSVISIVIVVGAAALCAKADPYQPKWIPAGAKWFAHVDLTRAINSQFGQLVIHDLQALGLQNKLDAIQELLGVDPLSSFKSITLYGLDYGEDNGIGIIEMGPDIGKLDALVKMADGYETSQYQDYTIHSWIDKGHGSKRNYGAVMPMEKQHKSLIIISHDRDAVTKEITLINGKGKTLADDRGSMMMVTPADGTVLLAAGFDIAEFARQREKSEIFQAARSISLNVGEADERVFAKAKIVAVDAKQATAMQQMITGLVAVVRLSQQPDSPLVKFINEVTISQTGDTVTVEFSYPSAELYAMLKQLKQEKQAEQQKKDDAKAMPESSAQPSSGSGTTQ